MLEAILLHCKNMQNIEILDVFEILIAQKLLKCPKDPFVRSALIYKHHFQQIQSQSAKISANSKSNCPDFSKFKVKQPKFQQIQSQTAVIIANSKSNSPNFNKSKVKLPRFQQTAQIKQIQSQTSPNKSKNNLTTVCVYREGELISMLI